MSWAAGEAPPIDDSEPGPDLGAVIPRSTQTVLFGGVDIDDPVSLAAALQTHWSDGLERLFQEPDPALVEETIAFCESRGLDAAAALLRERPAGDDVPRHYARLLAALDAGLSPEFDGIDLRPVGLEAAARRVIETGDEALAVKLETVRRAQILRTWRHLPGMATSPEVASAWAGLRSDLEDLGAGFVTSLPVAERRDLGAWLLLVALDRRHSDDLQRRREALDLKNPGDVVWWKGLLADNRPAATAAVVVTYPRAAAEAGDLREQQRQAKAARLAAEVDRKRREEAERIAAFRTRRRDAVRFTLGLLVLYFVLALVASIVLMLFAAQETYLKASGEGDWAAAFYSMMSVALVLALACWILDLILAWTVGTLTQTIWLELVGLVLGIVALNRTPSATFATSDWTLLTGSFQTFIDNPGARWTYPMIAVAIAHAISVAITYATKIGDRIR